MLLDLLKVVIQIILNLLSLPQQQLFDLIEYNLTSLTLEYLPDKHKRKVKFTINELLETEKNYVAKLSRGIEIYVKPLDITLNGDYDNSFRDVQDIFAFHKDKFLPLLENCDENIDSIVNLFHTYIMNDCFYHYVMYGMRKPQVEAFVNKHKDVFTQLRQKPNDRLGIESFMLEPIQRLPRYKLLFNEISKTISSVEDDALVDIQRWCSIVEKDILRLLNTVNEALNLNQYQNFDAFNIFNQGNFKKMNEFEMVDSRTGQKFKGFAFLFEKSLLCTESKNGALEYRLHIVLEDILYIDKMDGGESLKINLNNWDVDLYSNKPVTEQWVNVLTKLDEQGLFLLVGSTWHEQTYMRILLRIEKHFLRNLNLHKEKYAEEAKLIPTLADLISLYDTILVYHNQKVVPALQNPRVNLFNVCQLFKDCLSDTTFSIYKKYAILAPYVYKELKMKNSEDLERFIRLPFYHLSQYTKFFTKMVKIMFNHPNINKRLVQTAATVQVEINKFEKFIMDNYEIHLLSLTKEDMNSFGIIQYSDLVTIDGYGIGKYKIFLMETAVIAVELKPLLLDENEQLERYVWTLPYETVEYRNSNKVNKRLKLSTKRPKHLEYSITFRTVEKMKQFISQLEVLKKPKDGSPGK